MTCFQKRLNELFRESGKTREVFAKDIAEVSRQSLYDYLNGKCVPDGNTIYRICQKCNVSADWLLGLSDVKTIEENFQTACKTLNISEQTARNISETDLDGLLSNRDLLCFVDALYKRFREHAKIAEDEEPQTFPVLPKGYQIVSPGLTAANLAHHIGASFEMALLEELKIEVPDWFRKATISI